MTVKSEVVEILLFTVEEANTRLLKNPEAPERNGLSILSGNGRALHLPRWSWVFLLHPEEDCVILKETNERLA